jgi:hypothetical protein
VDLNVHLGEGLVEVLDLLAGVADEVGAVAQECAHGTDVFGGPEAGAEQADGVEILNPLAVADVGLAAREIFALAGVDEADFEAGSFEDLEERDPIDAGGLQGDGLNATLQKPVAQLEEIVGEGGEGADGFGVGVAGDGDLEFAGADINAGSVRVQRGELDVGCRSRSAVGLEYGAAMDRTS